MSGRLGDSRFDDESGGCTRSVDRAAAIALLEAARSSQRVVSSSSERIFPASDLGWVRCRAVEVPIREVGGGGERQ